MANDEDQASEGEDAREDLRYSDRQDRAPDGAPNDREEQCPDCDSEQERREDKREDVRGVAGARRQQPRPEHLVAERGQARHECQHDGEPRPGNDADLLGRLGEVARHVMPIQRDGPPSTPAEQERGRSRGARADGTDYERPGQAQQLDKENARRQGAHDGADCVRRVEAAEGTGEVRTGGEMARQRWKGGPHQDGRRGKPEHCEAKAQQGDELRPAFKRRIGSSVHLVEQVKGERGGQHDHHQHQLDHAVEAEWRPDPVREPAPEEAADGHAAEESGQDRGDRLRGVAENQHQLARPDDLVDESGGA